jgi:hypothetical protein
MNAASDEALLLDVVRALQHAVLRHPLAAQAAFSALVAEGRRFSRTPEGQEWRARLAGSALVAAGRSVLDTASLHLLEESEDEGIPARLLEALALAARHPALERALAEALAGEEED